MASDRAKRIHAALKRQGQTERVTYWPLGGRPRAIDAPVERGVPAPYMHATAAVIRVTALNDAVAGIDAAALDAGGDKVGVPDRPGAAEVKRAIARLVPDQTDADWTVVEVR